MIKKENNSVLLPKKTFTYLTRKYQKHNKKVALIYARLLAEQQNGTYFENLTEMESTLNTTTRTIKKYVNILKKEGLIYKYDDIYIINMSPQKQILKAEINRINRQDKYLFNKYMKAD